jgi:hypothetical protein
MQVNAGHFGLHIQNSSEKLYNQLIDITKRILKILKGNIKIYFILIIVFIVHLLYNMSRCKKIRISDIVLIKKILLCKKFFFYLNIISTYWERYDIIIKLNHVIIIRITMSVKFFIN